MIKNGDYSLGPWGWFGLAAGLVTGLALSALSPLLASSTLPLCMIAGPVLAVLGGVTWGISKGAHQNTANIAKGVMAFGVGLFIGGIGLPLIWHILFRHDHGLFGLIDRTIYPAL